LTSRERFLLELFIVKITTTPWTQLTNPHPSLPAKQQRSARLLAGLLLFVIFTAVANVIFQIGLLPAQPIGLYASQFLGMAMLLGVYALSRSPYFRWAIFLFVIVFDLIIAIDVLGDPQTNTIMVIFLTIPVYVTCLLVSLRQSLIFAAVNLLLTLSLMVLAPPPSLAVACTLTTFYLSSTALFFLFIQHYYRQEAQKNALLEIKENRLRTFIQEADDWIFSLDENGYLVSANAKACTALGVTEADIVGKKPQEFVKPEDQPLVDAIIGQLFNGKSITSVEIEIPTAKGPVWLDVRGRILMNGGQVAGTIHIARDITERKLAFSLQQKMNRETSLLYESGRQLAYSLDFQIIYTTIDELVTKITPCSLLVIYECLPESKQLVYVYVRQGSATRDVQPLPAISLDSNFGDARVTAVTTETIQLLKEETAVSSLLAAIPLPDEPTPAKSALLLPLKFENQVHHLIQIFTPQPTGFTPEDRRFWEAFSQQTAVALANARLFSNNQREIQERRRAELEAYHRQAEAETLRQAAAILNSSLSLNVVLTRILEQLRRTIPYDSASVQQKVGSKLIIRAAQGFQDNSGLINLGFLITADLPNAHALRTLCPLAVDNVRATYPSFNLLAPDYQAERIISWLGVPLVVDETVLGMITIDRNEIRPFTKEEISMAVTFANHASIALRNAHLYQEMEDQNLRLEKAVAARTADLQRTTDQIEAIFNSSPDALLLLDTQYNVERVNPAVETLFGYQREEVLNHPPLALTPPEYHDRFIQAFQTAITTGAPQRFELLAQRKNDSQFDVTVALAPIYEQGSITAVVCSLHDISAFKEIDRLKDDFVSNVSHELRTPIANLKLHHDLIKLNPQKQTIYLERQEREIERLTTIIESLLRLSRLDQKDTRLTVTAVDLLALAQLYVQDRTTLAERQGLTLECMPGEDLPAARADGRLLGQAIGIILTNALSYTPPGGVISLRGHTRQQANSLWVGLSIQDTGPGIPPEDKDLIFNRFYRGQAGRTSGAPGTGLGLAIAQEIIALHRGKIEVDSPGPNLGTTFTMWLPAADSQNE